MTLLEQYRICQVRGHEPDNNAGTFYNAVPNATGWLTCKHCRTQYTTIVTREKLERNKPEGA